MNLPLSIRQLKMVSLILPHSSRIVLDSVHWSILFFKSAYRPDPGIHSHSMI